MELQRLLARFHDGVQSPVWGMDRALMGLHESNQPCCCHSLLHSSFCHRQFYCELNHSIELHVVPNALNCVAINHHRPSTFKQIRINVSLNWNCIPSWGKAALQVTSWYGNMDKLWLDEPQVEC